MTSSSTIPPLDLSALRRALRDRAGSWIQRFYRHEMLVARAVRGAQNDVRARFDIEVVQPALREIAGRLATFDPRGADVSIDVYPQLRALEAELQAIVQRGVGSAQRLASERMHGIADAETAFVRQSAERTLGVTPPTVDANLVQTRVEQRPFLGAKADVWFEKMLRQPTADRVRQWIQTGLQQGLTTDEIVRGLRGQRKTGYTDGILTGRPRHEVAALVSSYATHTVATARMESFRLMGFDKWAWTATLDLKTCPVCAKNEKDSPYPVGEGPTFPAHPNCRCTPRPWTEDAEGEGTRASMGGQVPASTGVEDYWKGLSAADQDQVLGKARAAAWRSGRLTLDRMLGPDLTPLSLAELRRLDRIPDDE